MKRRRGIKFGYTLVGTTVVVDDEESKLIQQIFQYFLEGLSTSQILKIVNSTHIKYYLDGSDWVRANIILILGDETYMGTELYPQIISPEMFEKVRELRDKKSHKKDINEQLYIEVYKDKMKCAVCGGKIRRLSRQGKHPPKFHCENKKCECKKTYIKQNEFENYLKILFAEIADGSIDIENEINEENNPCLINEIKKKTNELRLHMQDSDSAIEDVLNEIKAITSMRFDACTKTDNSAQTEFIVDILKKEKNNERVSADAIDKVIKKIQIETDKSVKLTIFNGKEFIERMA